MSQRMRVCVEQDQGSSTRASSSKCCFLLVDWRIFREGHIRPEEIEKAYLLPSNLCAIMPVPKTQ